MQKILAFCALSSLLLLAACGGQTPGTTSTPAPTAVAQATTAAPPTAGGPTPDPLRPTSTILSILVTEYVLLSSASPETPATLRPTTIGEAPIPGPGTLSYSETEDPSAELPFNVITVVRTDGPLVNGVAQIVTIEILANGTITRNGVQGTVSPETIAEINRLISATHFFSMQNVYMSLAPTQDNYTFRITVDTGGISRTITATDMLMPQELRALTSFILIEADRLPRATEAS